MCVKCKEKKTRAVTPNNLFWCLLKKIFFGWIFFIIGGNKKYEKCDDGIKTKFSLLSNLNWFHLHESF